MRSVYLVLGLLLSTLAAAAQAPVVRASLEPTKGIIVGQPVRLIVEVLVPNYFTGSPEFPDFELENAIVVLPQETPQNTNEQISGKSYAGIIETYSIYPQQPGDFKLPPVQITVSYAGAPPKTTVAHVPLPALTFHADVPAEAASLSYFLPTTSLTMQQKWSSPLNNIRAGDTIERTITITASKMQAMLIPPLPMGASTGIRIYQEQPIVQDQKTDRGEFVFGRRTQSAKYFIQNDGDYTLPPIELKWWNLSTHHLVTTTLPAVHFTAAANPDFVAELPPEPEPTVVTKPTTDNLWAKYKFWIRTIAPYSLAVLLLLWLTWRYLPRTYRALEAKHLQRKHSEREYFSKLLDACRQNDNKLSYYWLLQWLGRQQSRTSLVEFLYEAHDSALSAEISSLGASLFAKSGKEYRWNGNRLALLLKHHRKYQPAATKKYRHLPGLNP